MDVQMIRATSEPERLVCRAARGDYYDGFVATTDYEELMQSVDYSDDDIEQVKEIRDPNYPKADRYWHNEAATYAFIEKQLSRGHYGPWEHPQVTFAVKGLSRTAMAQITRHRHMTFDVQSQRYVDFSEADAVLPRSLEVEEHFSRDEGLVDLDVDREELRELYEDHTGELFDLYEELVDAGVPKEDARFLLPTGTKVNLTMSGNLRTMMHVLNLRQKANAQWEVRELSNKMADQIESVAPYTGRWWAENGPVQISP